MNKEDSLPAGSRPAKHSPTRKQTAIPEAIGFVPRPTVDCPMLTASPAIDHSLFSFRGRCRDTDDGARALGSYEFLPSVGFDDLQSSLESASADFKLTQFPSSSDRDIVEQQSLVAGKMVERPNVTRSGGTTRVAIQQPALRSTTAATLPRRPSLSKRQSSITSTVSSIQGGSSVTAAVRQRHYPPVSNHHSMTSRQSVASTLYGTGEQDGKIAQQRRVSVKTESRGLDSIRSPVAGASRPIPDSPHALSAVRTTRAKSMQPPPRLNIKRPMTPEDSTVLSPDSHRVSTALRSPQTSKGPTPASARRMSYMPAYPSHASGLGARTISPTDAKLDAIHGGSQAVASPRLPASASAQLPAGDVRPSSRSPSMLPRKMSTPSSSRTTPDVGRKSYSSGLSINSTNSYNTVRTSTGSIQQRVAQSLHSRLPAPKAAASTGAADEEGDVPPVPAIPKAFESPKDSQAEQAFMPTHTRMSNLASYDASRAQSNSAGSLSLPQSENLLSRASVGKGIPASRTEGDGRVQASRQRKQSSLAPLSLPPIHMARLPASTTKKIASLKSDDDPDRMRPWTPSRQMTKTPATPRTASMATFFKRPMADDGLVPCVHTCTAEAGCPADVNSANSCESIDTAGVKCVSHGRQRSGMSPYLSSSVPNGGFMESANRRRAKTGNAATLPLDVQEKVPISLLKPSGPRDQKAASTKAPPVDKSANLLLSSPEEPPTPSSISSLRRKLSLSWKRSASKASRHQRQQSEEKSGTANGVLPPKLPISATLNSIHTKPSSPTTSAMSSGNSSYLESRRRKSSASSLNALVAQERNRHDSSLVKKETLETVKERHTMPAPSSSVVSKILRHRTSAATVRSDRSDVWVAEKDRDDLVAEEEMKKLGARRKETEVAAKTLDLLRERATRKERVCPKEAIRIAGLNRHERGEIIDYKDVYFCGTQKAAKVEGDAQSTAPNFGYDDERGDYAIVVGDHLAFRYEIVDILGKGSFGQVVRCIDHKLGTLVAVKIIRNKKRFHQQGIVEIGILQKLREWDPESRHSMVMFTHSFYFRGHLCISTELLDINLYEFIKLNSFRGFSLKLIRRFTKQILSSLLLLKQHKVIHCDLKPENILLRHPLHSEIKVIDFGSSCFEAEKVYTYIQSRFYRSPEVILGLTYGLPIDMWSLACILAELYTGVPLFPGENEQEQLACIMEVFGPPEKHLIEKSTRKKLFFDSMGKPRLTMSSKGRRRRPSSKTLQQLLKCEDEAFLDFLTRCLRWDPDRRLRPEDAVQHAFITGQKTTMPVPRAIARESSSPAKPGSSPAKRIPSTNAPRPLPEPPGGLKISSSLRPRDLSGGGTMVGGSPLKSNLGSRRTLSVSTALHGAAGGPPKRTSLGPGPNPMSGLPRVAHRSMSAKHGSQHDLAVTGANVAMMRRV